jgi:Mce-associated membrane protein
VLNQPRRRFGVPVIAAGVLVLAAAGFLGWSAVGFVSAGSDVERAKQDLAVANERLDDLREDDTIETKTARDEALDAARTGVVAMNTLDYRTVDDGLREWERATTGSLHDEIVNSRAQTRQAIANARSVTKAAVLSAAVKAVDDRAGTATVLVALRVNVTLGDAAPTEKFVRIQSTLQRTDQGWKLDSIGQVPYQ